MIRNPGAKYIWLRSSKQEQREVENTKQRLLYATAHHITQNGVTSQPTNRPHNPFPTHIRSTPCIALKAKNKTKPGQLVAHVMTLHVGIQYLHEIRLDRPLIVRNWMCIHKRHVFFTMQHMRDSQLLFYSWVYYNVWTQWGGVWTQWSGVWTQWSGSGPNGAGSGPNGAGLT